MRFKFECKDRDPLYDGVAKKVTVETEEVSLTDDNGFGLLYDIKCFLLACGFVIKGDLEIVDEYGDMLDDSLDDSLDDELFDNLDDDDC